VETVLGKRAGEDLEWLWNEFGLRYHENGGEILNPAGIHLAPAPPPYVPPQNPAVHVPPQGPADSDPELMDLDDDAPPGSPESTHSHSWPTSPEGSTESEDWHTAPSSPLAGTPSTELDSDLDSDYRPAISNAPSAESLSETADSGMRGKAKVSRRISGTASGVDTVNAARTELWSADPGGP
jgi:hypothetical protein